MMQRISLRRRASMVLVFLTAFSLVCDASRLLTFSGLSAVPAEARMGGGGGPHFGGGGPHPPAQIGRAHV